MELFFNVFFTVIEVSAAASLAIIILLLVRGVLQKRYSVKLRYWIWIVLAVRLILPVNFSLPSAPVVLTLPVEVKAVAVVTDNNAGKQNPVLDQVYDNEAFAGAGEQNTVLSPAGEFSAGSRMDGHTTIEKDPILILAVIWALGMIGTLGYYISCKSIYKKKIHDCSKRAQIMIEHDDYLIVLKSAVASISKEIGLRRNVEIVFQNSYRSPMVTGILKPMLLLPESFLEEKVDLECLEIVLRHELLHIKRRDVIYKAVLILAKAVHWFNPLVHLMVKIAERDLEMCCDEVAVAGRDMKYRREYSLAILSLMKGEKRVTVPLSAGFSGGKETMKRRFENILDMGIKKRGMSIFAVAVLLVVSTGAFIACDGTGSDVDAGIGMGAGADVEGSGKISYVDERLGFSLEFPETWEGKYVVEAVDEGILIYHKEIKENTKYNGCLAWIFRETGENLLEETVNAASQSDVILQGNGWTYIASYDTPYGNWPKDDERLKEECLKMSKEMSQVYASAQILSVEGPESLEQSTQEQLPFGERPVMQGLFWDLEEDDNVNVGVYAKGNIGTYRLDPDWVSSYIPSLTGTGMFENSFICMQRLRDHLVEGEYDNNPYVYKIYQVGVGNL